MELTLGQLPCGNNKNGLSSIETPVIDQSAPPTHLDQIAVVLRVSLQVQRVEQVDVASIEELIEDVEVSFSVVLVHDSGFLQQVVQDVTSYWRSLKKVQTVASTFVFVPEEQPFTATGDKIFTLKSNWMSMYFPKRLELSFLSVLALPNACTERQNIKLSSSYVAQVSQAMLRSHLQDWVGLQEAITEGLHMAVGGAGDSVVQEDLLGGLGFTCSTLTGYKDALVLPLCLHGPVCVV